LQKLRRELDLYDSKLSERPWLIVANKMDLPEAAEKLEHFRGRYKKVEIIPISAEQNEGTEQLKARLGALVGAAGGGALSPAT
jgi:GTP-binding protein